MLNRDALKYGKEEIVPVKARGTKRIRCRCYNLFQDERYGAGIRVHNRMVKGALSSGQWWRCACCGMEKQS